MNEVNLESPTEKDLLFKEIEELSANLQRLSNTSQEGLTSAQLIQLSTAIEAVEENLQLAKVRLQQLR